MSVTEGEADVDGVTLGDAEVEGVTLPVVDGVAVLEGVIDTVGVLDGVMDVDGVTLGVAEVDGVTLRVMLVEGVLLGVMEGVGDTEGTDTSVVQLVPLLTLTCPLPVELPEQQFSTPYTCSECVPGVTSTDTVLKILPYRLVLSNVISTPSMKKA